MQLNSSDLLDLILNQNFNQINSDNEMNWKYNLYYGMITLFKIELKLLFCYIKMTSCYFKCFETHLRHMQTFLLRFIETKYV